MRGSKETIKEKLADYYNRSVRRYHTDNYLNQSRYSPLRYRQYYIEKMIEDQKIPNPNKSEPKRFKIIKTPIFQIAF